MARLLNIVVGTVGIVGAAAAAAVFIGGPDLIYPRVAGTNYGPTSIAFEDTDPASTIGGTITLGRAPNEKGVDVYMVHWGLEVGNAGTEDDTGHGDHGGSCKGFRDTNHVVKALPSQPGDTITMEIPQGTAVPEGALYFVAHTLYGDIHNLAKCVQTPIVNRVD
ncbi:MAG: hypothetical protein HOP13_10595 [Alphaproteobacteria bacterium]|nr:hypothetical protein [Alphaproteobacteria bacterium]